MPVIVAPTNPPRVVVVQRRATASVQMPARDAVITQAQQSVGTVTASTVAVEVGSRGPQGPKGDPGDTTFQRPAASVLSALRVVYEVGGAVAPADPHDADQVGAVVGLAVTAASAAGTLVDIQTRGAVDDAGWNWTDGPVFLGADGALTQTPPTAGWEVVVGWPLSPTRLNLTFDEPILL